MDSFLHRLEAGALSFADSSLVSALTLELRRVCVRLIRRCRRQGQASLRAWLVALTVLLILVIWNSYLVLAIAIGLGVTFRIDRRSRQSGAWLQQSLRSSFAPIPLSATSGSLATLGTYSFLEIWRHTGSFGLAIAALLPELSVLVLMGVLVSQSPSLGERTRAHLYDWAVADLVALNPLKRLIAVRQLTQWGQQQPLPAQQRREITDYLQLLLQQEPDPLVRNAVQEGLERLQLKTLPDLSTRPYPKRCSRPSMTLRVQQPVLHPTTIPSFPQT